MGMGQDGLEVRVGTRPNRPTVYQANLRPRRVSDLPATVERLRVHHRCLGEVIHFRAGN